MKISLSAESFLEELYVEGRRFKDREAAVSFVKDIMRSVDAVWPPVQSVWSVKKDTGPDGKPILKATLGKKVGAHK